jgi:hypothetical protein
MSYRVAEEATRVVYDESGAIVHVHQAFRFEHARAFDHNALDQKALRLAASYSNLAPVNLRVLRTTPDSLERGRQYRVDTQAKKLVMLSNTGGRDKQPLSE